MRVLTVDDSGTMRKIIARALKEIGIEEVGEAGDGLEALKALEAGPYDLMLLDWNMPNMTGIEVVQKVRADGGTIPIIMVTTEAEKRRIIEALKCGANNYVVKPFTPEILTTKVKETLAKAGKQIG